MTWPARGTSRSVTSRSTFPSGRWMFARDAGVPTIASLTDARPSLTDGRVLRGQPRAGYLDTTNVGSGSSQSAYVQVASSSGAVIGVGELRLLQAPLEPGVLEAAVVEVELDVRGPVFELEALAELLDQCERARVDVARVAVTGYLAGVADGAGLSSSGRRATEGTLTGAPSSSRRGSLPNTHQASRLSPRGSHGMRCRRRCCSGRRLVRER